MSTSFSPNELVAIPSPHVEPRLAFQRQVSRKVDNLTLIDGKTFLSTTVAGDIVPAGAPDVGFFHDDTRFLSHLELRINGQPSIVLSSNTERTFVAQIELATEQMKLRDSFEIAENTIHIRRQQLLNDEVLFDRFSLVNFNNQDLNLSLAISFDADFVDVFQVRGTPAACTASTIVRSSTVTASPSSIAALTVSSDRRESR
jgi:glycogen debranching enzyme